MIPLLWRNHSATCCMTSAWGENRLPVWSDRLGQARHEYSPLSRKNCTHSSKQQLLWQGKKLTADPR